MTERAWSFRGPRKPLPIPCPNEQQGQHEDHESEDDGQALPATAGRLGAEHALLFRRAFGAPPFRGADDGRAELSRESRPKGGEKLDARRGPSWNGRSENDWEGGNAALATFDEKPPWPGAAVPNIGGVAYFLKDDGERGFDAASYDVAVWAGHGKGDQAGARRSLRIVSDPCDSCRTKHPAYLSDAQH